MTYQANLIFGIVMGMWVLGILTGWVFRPLFGRTSQEEAGAPPERTEESPSYHDVVVYVNGQAHKISDNYGYELTCTRVGGWELWFRGSNNWGGMVQDGRTDTNPSLPSKGDKPVLIGGEFDGGDFRIEVNGFVVCASPKGGDVHADS